MSITGEHFIAIEQGKNTFKAIEKYGYGLRKTVWKNLKALVVTAEKASLNVHRFDT